MSPRQVGQGYRRLAFVCAIITAIMVTPAHAAAGTAGRPAAAVAGPATPPSAVAAPLAGRWSPLTIAGPPPAPDATLAWDHADGVMFSFEGPSSPAITGALLWAYRPAATRAGPAGWTHLAARGSAPHARIGASLVWDDRDGVLFLLDGIEGGHETSSLWAYKPGRGVVAGRGGATPGRWIDLTTTATPLRRAYHTAVWDAADGVMLVFGGEASATPLSDTWAYRPGRNALAPGTWSRIATPTGPSPRQRAIAVWDTSDGVMLLAGGESVFGFLSDLWAFRPSRHGAAGTWIRLATTTPLGPRSGGASAWDSRNHRWLIFGGRVPLPAPSPSATPRSTATPSTTVTPTLTVTATPTLTTTSSPTAVPATPTPTDTATSSPTATPSLSPTASPTTTATATPSASSTATASPTGSPTVTPTDSPTATASAPPTTIVALAMPAIAAATGTVTSLSSPTHGTTGSATAGRAAIAAVAVSRHGVGAHHPSRGTGPRQSGAPGGHLLVTPQGAYADDTWTYTPRRHRTGAGTWRLLEQGGPLARAAGAVYDDRDRAMLLHSGQSFIPLDDVWALPVAGRGTGRWTERDGGQPAGRAGQAGAWDARDGVLFIFGGFSGTWLNDLWAYKPARGAAGHWTLLSLLQGPAPRTEASLVWDDRDNVLLLFGGSDFHGSMNDVWAYIPAGDGTGQGRWSQMAVTGAPLGRHLHTAVWDSTNHQMLIYAGESSTAVLGDLWAFRPTSVARRSGTWQQLAAQAPPGPRFAQSAAWDPRHGRMLVFGGVSTAGTFLDDLWAYSPRGGTSGIWSALGMPHVPDARASAAVAWDPIDSALVLFGGTGAASIRNDTYAYRAAGGWSTLHPAGPPTRRDTATMVFDTLHRDLLLFGGTGASVAYHDLWQLGGTRPR